MPQPPRKRKPKGEPAPVVLTPYIVLRRAEVREEPVEENAVTEVAWLPVLEQVDEAGGAKAWRVRVVQARDQNRAIEAITGPDGPDIVEGTWKAVAVSSWRGGVTTVRTLKSDRLPLEEALP